MKKIFFLLLSVFIFSTSNAKDVSEFFNNIIPGEGLTEASIQLNEDDNPDLEILALREFHTVANFEFQNQHGNWISQNNVKDKIYVANFFFTSCTTVCPKMSKNLMGVQNAFLNDNRVIWYGRKLCR